MPTSDWFESGISRFLQEAADRADSDIDRTVLSAITPVLSSAFSDVVAEQVQRALSEESVLGRFIRENEMPLSTSPELLTWQLLNFDVGDDQPELLTAVGPYVDTTGETVWVVKKADYEILQAKAELLVRAFENLSDMDYMNSNYRDFTVTAAISAEVRSAMNSYGELPRENQNIHVTGSRRVEVPEVANNPFIGSVGISDPGPNAINPVRDQSMGHRAGADGATPDNSPRVEISFTTNGGAGGGGGGSAADHASQLAAEAAQYIISRGQSGELATADIPDEPERG